MPASEAEVHLLSRSLNESSKVTDTGAKAEPLPRGSGRSAELQLSVEPSE